ncbi:MAG: lysophospholipid acyltransferase family protein [Dissulfurispiraceae bacterium]
MCKRILYRYIPYCFLYPLFKVLGRLKVEGLENLRGNEGTLIAANHLSYIDPPLLAVIVPDGCVFLAKHELFDIPILKHLISYYAVPVNRQRVNASAIKVVLTKLAHGEKIVIFPEGSRNKGTSLLEPKNGVGMITVLSKKKVIPVLIKGTDKFLPSDKIFPRPARVQVIFGKPLDLGQDGADYGKISSLIIERIRNMDR